MDPDSMKQAFALRNAANGATVAGTLTLENGGSQLVFQPTSRLELGTRYQITVLGTAKSASGNANLANPTTAVFITVPYLKVIGSQPPNGGKAEPGQAISIAFNAIL